MMLNSECLLEFGVKPFPVPMLFVQTRLTKVATLDRILLVTVYDFRYSNR